MPDLLLEIATAEMSREILQTIAANLSSRVDEALAENSRAQQEIRLFYTPRRVALIASDLPEERFTDRKLTGVVSGILKSVATNTEHKELKNLDPSQARLLFPIRHLVCLYGERVISASVENIVADRVTRGHWRTNQEEQVVLSSPDDYEQALAGRGVIVNPDRRGQMVTDAIAEAAREAATPARFPEGLLQDIADEVEFPEPVSGVVNLPSDLPTPLVATALREAGLVLLAVDRESVVRFVGFADGTVDRDAVRAGYERVAQSALRGCKAIFARDRETSLADHVRSLRGMSDAMNLGSLWEKTERLRLLSEQIARVLDASVETVDRVAFLSQADLATWIVREFPSLHGIAGAIYAKLDGEDPSVCIALEEGGKSRAETGIVQGTVEGLAIAIAVRCDDLCCHLLLGNDVHLPRIVGIADDLASLMIDEKIDLDLASMLGSVSEQYRVLAPTIKGEELEKRLRTCLEEHFLEYLDRSEKITSLITSAIPKEVRANPYRSRNCARALQDAMNREGSCSLLDSYRKLSTISSARSNRVFDPSLFEAESERDLWREYLKAEGKLKTSLAESDYAQAIDELAMLGEAIDRYTRDVDSHAGSIEVRNNRQGLIACVVDLYMRVGDFDALIASEEHVPGEEKR